MRRFGAIVLALATVACGSAGARSDDLVVFAASSLRDVFPQIEPRARFNFAGSDQLATQIREGARADVYAAASPAHVARLREEVDSAGTFATNRLVLIVPRANPAHIRSFTDLEKSGVKLVIGAPGVPIGDYTRDALETLGAAGALKHVVSEEQDAKSIAGKVALGEADAGIVYATDVVSVHDRVTAIEIQPGVQPQITYVIAVLRESSHRAAAQAFVAKVTGEDGRRALMRAGFGLP